MSEDEVLQNPEVKALLEQYVTIMMHKDLVDLVTEYSIVKGRDKWEESFEKLLQDEIKSSLGKETEVKKPTENNVNVKKFKI